jgi:hypothetical protein
MIRRNPKLHLLSREISVALVVKLMLLLLLWAIFFRAPPHIDRQAVANTLFPAPADAVRDR